MMCEVFGTGCCQVEDEEEEKRGETVQAPPDGDVAQTDEVLDVVLRAVLRNYGMSLL